MFSSSYGLAGLSIIWLQTFIQKICAKTNLTSEIRPPISFPNAKSPTPFVAVYLYSNEGGFGASKLSNTCVFAPLLGAVSSCFPPPNSPPNHDDDDDDVDDDAMPSMFT
ncbi:hypothetical protein Hanom_Chr04g00321151 [Helianthus anomalus]